MNYEDEFVIDFEDKRKDTDGFGLRMTRATEDQRDMAAVFDAPEDEEDAGVELFPVPESRMEPPTDLAPLELDEGPAYSTPVRDAREQVQGTPLEGADKADAPAADKQAPAARDWDLSSFGEAFKHHRAEGASSFRWRGKMYTTEQASDTTGTPASAKPAEPAPRKPAQARSPWKPIQQSARPQDAERQDPPMASGRHAPGAAAPGDRSRLARTEPVRNADGSTRPAASVAEAMAASHARRQLDQGPPASAAGARTNPLAQDRRTRAQKDADERLYATRPGSRAAERADAPIPRR